ncbi:MAG: AAA family ATPase [Neisseriales bacterium]|nr:MAG: AAA family ATPase [Neisseriales bacterium]
MDERLAYANSNALSYSEFIELLLEDEANNRRDNSHNKRYARAKFPIRKTIAEFDFSFQPSIDKRQLNDAATCQFIRENQNVVFIGSPGTGKTHLSIALGIQALLKGHKVLFSSVADMLYNLHTAKADNSFYKKLNYYLEPDLLILDELGFKEVPAYSADDFFEVISRRYEKGSVIISTNKPFEQWGEIFADNILAGAILDRIVHHSLVFKISGPSYRAKKVINLNGQNDIGEEVIMDN